MPEPQSLHSFGRPQALQSCSSLAVHQFEIGPEVLKEIAVDSVPQWSEQQRSAFNSELISVMVEVTLEDKDAATAEVKIPPTMTFTAAINHHFFLDALRDADRAFLDISIKSIEEVQRRKEIAVAFSGSATSLLHHA